MINKLIFSITLIFITTNALAVEYFVRPNGGTLENCNGTTNVDYSNGIANKACAVKHIFELLNPETQTAHITGGDIITIMNNSNGTQAEYEMGRHDDYTGGECNSSWNYSCDTPSIPGGSLNSPTIIRGETWNTGCDVPPQLWGSGRANTLLKIKGDNITLSCLEITDHSGCIGASSYPDASLKCNRNAPYDKPFADIGLKISDATNITLSDLKIMGLDRGIMAGRLGDVTLNRVHLYGNFGAGWEGDLADGGGSSNTGTILFNDSAITFNGCGVIYNPGQSDHESPHACAKQDLGGYGDGLGTAKTGGDWIFDNVLVMYNNSDGIDMLYHENGGKVTVRNSRIEGNGGNQLKVSGNSEIVNNIIISNCAWNSRQDAALGGNGENCRAFGTPLLLMWAAADDTVTLINNTVVSEGDCLLQSGTRTGVGSDAQRLNVVNNIFYGVTDYHQNFENSCMYYVDLYEGVSHEFPTKQIHNNIIHKTKSSANDPCINFQANIPAGNSTASAGECSTSVGSFYADSDYAVSSNPRFISLDLGIRNTAYDLVTLAQEANKVYPKDETSPVVNNGYIGEVDGVQVPTKDYFGLDRGSNTDIGAVELSSVNSDIPQAPLVNSVVPKN